ncbi:MAG: glycosyl hydrolase [Balneolaceae bacterium]
MKNLISFFLLISLLSCNTSPEKSEKADLPIDENATKETIALYNNLKELAKTNILYGHQDDLAYGYSWWAEDGRSDVKESTGSYPAIYGWELGDLRQDTEVSLDGVNFEQIKVWMNKAYERGGVNTISWHMNHPVTDGDSWDTTPGVAPILPGGEHHEKFKTWLDKFAAFALDLRGDDGELIPVIFRPYHEHTGSWFWWGDDQSTVEEYVTLWRFTVDYLKDEKNVHNLLYAYSPDGSPSRFQKYMEKYPGDKYVDILGLDDYGTFMSEEKDLEFLSNNLAWLVEKAEKKNKIAALAETGSEALTNENWFTEELYPALTINPKAIGIAYVLTWRNANYEREQRDHFYASHPDHPSAPDMKAFRDTDLIMFEDELPELYTLDN